MNDFDAWRVRRLAEAHEYPRIVGGRIAAVGSRTAPKRRSIFSDHFDPRPEHVTWCVSSHEPQSQPVVAVANIIYQKPGPSGGVAHHNVHVTVVVDVAEGRAAAHFRQLEHRPRASGHILELSIAEIAVQLRRHSQWKRILRARQRFDRRHSPIRHEQIQPAIVVEIEPCSPEPGFREAGRAEPRRGPPVFEVARAVIHIENIHLIQPVRDEPWLN